MAVKFSSTTPAPPGGAKNVTWQHDDSGHASAYVSVDETDLVLSDVTTDDVSITKHGFAPRLPDDPAKFFNGVGDYVIPTPADADLILSDVTTNNVTSTKHGFAPRAPADATKFLNGAATGTYAAVKDSDLATTDITTNDVSISKHGFAPRAPNDVTKFLNGTGAYSIPSPSAAHTEIALAPGAGGNFSVAHGLGSTPGLVLIQMTSGGAIWFQTTRYDATNINLVASDAGLTGYAIVFP
jgi:hypothetical protein